MPVHGDARPQHRNGGGMSTNNAPSSSAPQQLLLHNGQEVNSSLIDAILDTDSFLVSRLSLRVFAIAGYPNLELNLP